MFRVDPIWYTMDDTIPGCDLRKNRADETVKSHCDISRPGDEWFGYGGIKSGYTLEYDNCLAHCPDANTIGIPIVQNH